MSGASSARPRPVSTEFERAAGALRVGGLTPLSATDWPGQLAAVVFCQGCPWRCGYCHNPHLLGSRGAAEIAWADVLAFLRRREGLLDAVVFSGGEPLAQRALAEAMQAVKDMGFRIGLHTGGAYPARLAQVLPLVDWVGFDIKAPFNAYPLITAAPDSGRKARASVQIVLASGIAHEFRTTVHPAQLGPDAVERMSEELARVGVRHYALQEFRAQGCANTALTSDATPPFLSESFAASIAQRFRTLQLRLAA